MALGSEGGLGGECGGNQDLLLIPFILIFFILVYWSQGPQAHPSCCSTSMPALYHGEGRMLSEDGRKHKGNGLCRMERHREGWHTARLGTLLQIPGHAALCIPNCCHHLVSCTFSIVTQCGI